MLQLDTGVNWKVTFAVQRREAHTVRALLESADNWTVSDSVRMYDDGISRLNPVVLRVIGDAAATNATQRDWQWSPVNTMPIRGNHTK